MAFGGQPADPTAFRVREWVTLKSQVIVRGSCSALHSEHGKDGKTHAGGESGGFDSSHMPAAITCHPKACRKSEDHEKVEQESPWKKTADR